MLSAFKRPQAMPEAHLHRYPYHLPIGGNLNTSSIVEVILTLLAELSTWLGLMQSFQLRAKQSYSVEASKSAGPPQPNPRDFGFVRVFRIQLPTRSLDGACSHIGELLYVRCEYLCWVFSLEEM